MVTLSLPKTLLSLSSARISRRFSGFCRLWDLMYSQTLLTTSPRGSGSGPTTAASASDGCSGRCNAFGLPLLAAVFAFFGVSCAVLVGIVHLQFAPAILARGRAAGSYCGTDYGRCTLRPCSRRHIADPVSSITFWRSRLAHGRLSQ